MRSILIDTNAYTAFKLGDASIMEIIQHATTIGISPIVLGELLGGFDCGSKNKQNRKELHAFLASSRVRFYPVGSNTANFYSQVYTTLKRKGKPIPTNDMWIAAQALEHGCMVCTYDKHFNAIDGLLTGNILTDFIV